jgi:hypothetical protein
MANNVSRMLAHSGGRRRRAYLPAAGLGLLMLEVGCGGASPVFGLHRDVACAPDAAVRQLREALSNLRTTDPEAVGKGYAITTDSLREQAGRQEREVKYRVVLEPLASGDGSTIRLERVEDKVKGVRERTWHDAEPTAEAPRSEQDVWTHVQSVCSAPH